ncbi:MAG: type VII secretion target [Mycobacterium sp.]
MATTLKVDTATLAKAADETDQATGYAQDGTNAQAGVVTDAWLTHGLVSTESNIKVAEVANVRSNTGTQIVSACRQLADNLRQAATYYNDSDLNNEYVIKSAGQ